MVAMTWHAERPVSVLLSEAVPEPIRSIALMAILGIVLLGMLLIVGTMLGANWVRKLGKYRRGPPVPPDVFYRSRSRSRGGRAPGFDARRFSEQETVVSDDSDTSDDTIVS